MTLEQEQQYLKQIAKGDYTAFDALFLLYYPKVRHFITMLIKEDEQAKDLAQDIFLKLWNSRSSLLHIKLFGPYLFKMSRNAVYDYYKHNEPIYTEATSSYTEVADPASIADDIDAHDIAMLIDIATETMSAQRKRIYTMSRKQGLSNDEISQQLNISKRTVETHISQALSTIRKVLTVITAFSLS